MASTSQNTVHCPGCQRTVPDKEKCYICGAQLRSAAPALASASAPTPPPQANVSAQKPATKSESTPVPASLPASSPTPSLQQTPKPVPTSRSTPPAGTQILNAHYVEKERSYLVTVAGRRVNMPHCCACCLGSADETFKVSAVNATQTVMGMDRGTITTISFDFPTCTDCRKHMQGDSLGALLAFLITGVVYVAVVYALGLNFFLDAADGHSLRLSGLATLAGMLVAGAFCVLWLKARFDQRTPDPGPGHAGRGRPVEANFASFKRAERDGDYPDAPITFIFRNRKFGELFIKANAPPG